MKVVQYRNVVDG